MALSYAAAARPKKKQPAPGRPPPKGTTTHCDRLQVSPENQSKINHSERRTQVLRRVPPTTTSGFIITELDRQLDAPITDFVEAVVQDCLDRRRYYIRYVSIEKKREVTRRGFQLGDIRIPGERADITGFVKDVPHYLTHEDMMSILGRYGDVVQGGFLTFGETNIRCGGFRFELDLHENTKLPNSIRILNDIMTVSQKDDHKTCGYCDRIGHITPHCRQRIQALEKRAMAELKQQENGIRQDEIQDEDMSGTSSEEYTDDEREANQSTTTPNTPLPQLQPTPSITTPTPTTDLVPTQVLHSLITTASPITTEDSQRLEPPTPTPSATQTPTQQNTSTQFVSGGQLQMEPEGHATPTEQPLGITLNPKDSDEDEPLQPYTYDDIFRDFSDTFTSYYDTFHMQYNQGNSTTYEAQQLLIKEATQVTVKDMLTKYNKSTWQNFVQQRRKDRKDEYVFDPYLHEQ